MALDLQKLTIRRLLETKNHDLYSKLTSVYFTGVNFVLFSRIQEFYKSSTRLPSIEEFRVVRKDDNIQEYYEKEILSEENKYDDVADEFLVNQLQDYYIREETISFLDKFIDDLPTLEKIEVVDKLQTHLLTLNKSIIVSEELFDVADLDFFSKRR